MKIHLNVVNGMLVEAAETIESLNPATSEPIGRVPISTKAEVDAAIAAARAAQPAWMSLSDDARRAALQRVADVLEENAEYLATWITCEQGKPLGGVGPDQIPGSRFEMWGCEVWTRVPASLDLAPEVVFEDETRRDVMHRQPYGVVAAIAPWNWPLLIAIWQIIPALRMGNTVVLKPSELTSICTLEMVRLIAEVLPPGVLNTVSGDGRVGGLLTSHPDVDKILFTGSTATGARISAVAAETVTPTTMELGGNDAAIVLADANPKDIAQGLFWGPSSTWAKRAHALSDSTSPNNFTMNSFRSSRQSLKCFRWVMGSRRASRWVPFKTARNTTRYWRLWKLRAPKVELWCAGA